MTKNFVMESQVFSSVFVYPAIKSQISDHLRVCLEEVSQLDAAAGVVGQSVSEINERVTDHFFETMAT